MLGILGLQTMRICHTHTSRHPDVYLLGALHTSSVLLGALGLWGGPLQALPILAGRETVNTEYIILDTCVQIR